MAPIFSKRIELSSGPSTMGLGNLTVEVQCKIHQPILVQFAFAYQGGTG